MKSTESCTATGCVNRTIWAIVRNVLSRQAEVFAARGDSTVDSRIVGLQHIAGFCRVLG